MTPRLKPWVIHSFSTFDSMDSMTIHWKAAEQYFTVVMFVFQFSFGLGTLRSERVKWWFKKVSRCSLFIDLAHLLLLP